MGVSNPLTSCLLFNEALLPRRAADKELTAIVKFGPNLYAVQDDVKRAFGIIEYWLVRNGESRIFEQKFNPLSAFLVVLNSEETESAEI